MSEHQQSTAGSSPDEELLTIKLLATFGLPVAVAYVTAQVDRAQQWALQHSVVVSADRAWWLVPGTDVGLDAVRTVVLVLAVGGLAAVVWAFTSAGRARRTRRALDAIARGER